MAMTAAPLIFVGTYDIPAGSIDDWHSAIREMSAFVEANVPRLIAFAHYVNEEQTEGTTVHVHPDSESLEQHLEAASSRIASGTQLVQVRRIDLYGAVSGPALDRLRRMSPNTPIVVKKPVGGFRR
jgi:hypothetical protein